MNFRNYDLDNPMPCKEFAGNYNRFEDISETNPLPVMVVDLDAYTLFEEISEGNPLPIAIFADGDYTKYEDLSEGNPLPIKIIEGQSYTRFENVSETNPLPVINTTESAYTGPLDLVPGAVGTEVAYGLFALRAAWLGQNVCRLQRDSDDAELDFACDASTGEFPTAETIAWRDAEGAATARLVTFFDQSGNGNDFTTGTPTAVWNSSLVGGKPGFTNIIITGVPVQLNGEISILAVHREQADYGFFDVGSAECTVGAPGADETFIYLEQADATKSCGGAFDASAILDANFYVWEVTSEFGSTTMKANGVSLDETDNYDSGGALANISGSINIDASATSALAVSIVYPTSEALGPAADYIKTYYGL